MVILLIHITSDSMEASLTRGGEIFFSRTLALHSDLKGFISDSHSKLSETKEKIGEVVVILGSPFFSAHIRIIEESHDKPIKIDANLLQKLIVNTDTGFEIENEILYSKINGYPVRNIVGKDASEIQLTVYQSKTQPEIIDELKNFIIQISKKISFHTFPYVAFRALSSLQEDPKPFILVEIGRASSTFSLINGESFIESSAIDKGIDHLIKSVMQRLNVDEKVAISLFAMKKDNTLDDKNKERLDQAIDGAMKEWNIDLFSALHKLSNGRTIPTEICLIASSEWSEIFKNTLSNNDYSRFSYDDKGGEVKVTDFTSSHIDVVFIDKHLI